MAVYPREQMFPFKPVNRQRDNTAVGKLMDGDVSCVSSNSAIKQTQVDILV